MDYTGSCQTGDDLFVDDLLDLSNALSDCEGDEMPCSISPQKQPQNNEADKQTLTNNKSPVKQDFSEFNLPGGDLDNLEWLSHFVEDSFSEYSLTYSPENLQEKPRISPVQEKSCFTSPIQTSSSSTVENKPAAEGRKPKKKMVKRGGIVGKQCSHCEVQKTPLWRTGPLGEKTLCNACGVRFKSGRLLPEYRPASSPTFSTGLHSNSHRKVLEMRQKKETELGRPVQSF